MLNIAEIFAEPIIASTMPVVKPTVAQARTREATTPVEAELVGGNSASTASVGVASEVCEAVRDVDPMPWEPVETIDAGELTPCPRCHSLETWWNLLDQPRCLRCDPPTQSRRIAELAVRIRGRDRHSCHINVE